MNNNGKKEVKEEVKEGVKEVYDPSIGGYAERTGKSEEEVLEEWLKNSNKGGSVNN